MAKNHPSEFDTTSINNSDVEGISLAENVMEAPAVNNAFRGVMSSMAQEYDDYSGVGTVGGTADAVTVAAAKPPSSLVNGLRFRFVPASDNATTTPTVAYGGLTATTIKKGAIGSATALVAGDIVAGIPADVQYSSSDSAFILNNPQSATGSELVSTDAGASADPTFSLYRNSASPADGDDIGSIRFNGKNDAAEKIAYAEIVGGIVDVTDGTEDGELNLRVATTGSLNTLLTLNSGAAGLSAAFNAHVFPSTDALYDLGTSSLGWADLYFSDASVINFGNGGHTITHLASDDRLTHNNNVHFGDVDLSSSSTRGTIVYGGGVNKTLETQVPGSAGNNENIFTQNRGTTTELRFQADGDVQNTNNTYGSISDERLKENIQPAKSQWADILAIELKNYDLVRATGDKGMVDLPEPRHHIGVIAQQVEKVSPALVTEDENGIKAVKYSTLNLKMFGALQEAMRRIEQLEAQIMKLTA